MSNPLGNSKASATAVETTFDSSRSGGSSTLAMRIAILGQGNSNVVYSNDKLEITSSKQAGDVYGYGSPIHLCSLILFSISGDRVTGVPVTVYPCDEPAGAAANTRTISITGTATETGTIIVSRGTSVFSVGVKKGSTSEDLYTLIMDQINGDINYPFNASIVADDDDETVKTLELTTKAKGAWGNEIIINFKNVPEGLIVTNTNNEDGAGNIDVTEPLNLLGNSWETLLINTSPYTDETTLNEIQGIGEGRWDPLITKPYIAINGTNETDFTTLKTFTNTRKDDRINVLFNHADSESLYFEIATNFAMIIANLGDQNPSRATNDAYLRNVVAGSEQAQPDFIERNSCVLAGLATSVVTDGLIQVKDPITLFHPTGDDEPAYRYIVNIIKLMNVINALNQRFAQEYWKGVALIPNGQTVNTNTGAKQPNDAKAEANIVVNDMAKRAILVNPEETIKNTIAKQSDVNNNRIDLIIPIVLSSNVNQSSTELRFAFNTGG